VNSDIYLFLIRQEGKFSTLSETWKSGKLALLASIPKWLKAFVMGDSLDAPFLKFIKVTNVDHSMGFGDGGEQLKYGDAGVADTTNYVGVEEYGDHKAGDVSARGAVGRSFQHLLGDGHFTLNRGRTALGQRASFESGNMFLQSHLPEHGKFGFSKKIDKATPQLAFGCSAQERFPIAIFFFRRRIGLGLEGSRMPYMVIGLEKVLISSWSLGGDSESVNLAYKRIGWAATDQISDMNISIPGFARTWDVESRRGGEGGWALGLQALTAGLVFATGAIAKALA
jgi:type VI protein secretion system component Hcp